MPTTHDVVTVTTPAGAMFFNDVATNTQVTTIVVGDSVSWSANDDDHSVVSDNVAPFAVLTPPLNGGLNQGGASYVYTFSTPGRFGYHCGIHGGDPVSQTPMYGIVQVNAR